MVTTNPHVLLEMSDEPDCRFGTAWLNGVVDAQALWSQALNDHRFADQVGVLHADGIPDLSAAARAILRELEHQCHVAALDLYSDENGLFCREFGLLVQLKFFIVDDLSFGMAIREARSYWMALPEAVTLKAVKQAAIALLSTADVSGDDVVVVQPERQLHTLSGIKAEAWRLKLIMMRRFDTSTFHHGSNGDTHDHFAGAPLDRGKQSLPSDFDNSAKKTMER